MIVLMLIAAAAALWTWQVPAYDRMMLLAGYGVGVVVSFVGMFAVSFERDRTVRRLRRQLRDYEEADNG